MRRINFRAIIGYLVILAIIVAVVMLGINVAKEMKNNKSGGTSQQKLGGEVGTTSKTVRISIDEWVGYDTLLQANGGRKTKKGSINDRNGINIEYVIENDYKVSSAALIKGDLQGAGYTVNRFAFLTSKFEDAKVDVSMPFITNYSNGGDGIIAKSNIKSIEDLAGKKVAVPKFSEAQTLVEWLVANSSLTADQQEQIRKSMVFFETPDEAAKAFFAGEVDAAATWEPFLTQAKTTTGARVLFDTSMSRNLILSGVIFREDFMAENEEFMKKFIDGVLEARNLYKKEFTAIREMPMFELMSDQEIIDMANGADLCTWHDNMDLLTDEAITMYRDMAKIWQKVGEKASPDKASSMFTDKYVSLLNSKYSSMTYEDDDEDAFSDEKKQQAQNIDNKEALMAKTLDIRFQPDSTVISEESYPMLNEFAETAKILDGVFIQIEGNTAKVPNADGIEFSKKRANSVARYLQSQGVDSSRLIIVGNGDTKPKGDNNTEEGKAINRRTDVFFKVVGY
ncbi:MAG: transporter substrate-binding domain-containing protein [Clostridiales bacterium]|nr:transporter substrate-binding domain-containing protein [Clostridiales bacterium]